MNNEYLEMDDQFLRFTWTRFLCSSVFLFKFYLLIPFWFYLLVTRNRLRWPALSWFTFWATLCILSLDLITRTVIFREEWKENRLTETRVCCKFNTRGVAGSKKVGGGHMAKVERDSMTGRSSNQGRTPPSTLKPKTFQLLDAKRKQQIRLILCSLQIGESSSK